MEDPNVPKIDGAAVLSMQKEADARNKKIERDNEYSNKFWESQGEISDNVRENMKDIILDCVQRGEMAIFVGFEKNGKIDEKSKQKLSAYRVLAIEIGYYIGDFVIHREAGTVIAKIYKKEAA